MASIHPPDVQSATDGVQHEIGAPIRIFQRISIAPEAFRIRCRASNLPILKQAVSDLHGHVQRLERLL